MPAIVLTITYDGKSTQVSGPLDNKLLAYGMLETARDVIAGFSLEEAKKDASRVQLAPGPLPLGLIHP